MNYSEASTAVAKDTVARLPVGHLHCALVMLATAELAPAWLSAAGPWQLPACVKRRLAPAQSPFLLNSPVHPHPNPFFRLNTHATAQ